MEAQIKALQDIVLGLPARDRRKFSSQIQLLQAHFGDQEDLISCRYGHHFLLRKVAIETEAGDEIGTMDRNEAAKYFNISTFELSRRLTTGKGETRLTIPNKKTYGVDAFIVTRLD